MSMKNGPTPSGRKGGGEPPEGWQDRTAPRFTALEFRAWIAWWKNDLELATGTVRLLDISASGALIEGKEPRPVGDFVLLTLDGLSPYESGVEATVVAVRPRRDRFRLHLSFTEPCPASLLHAALEGIRDLPRSGDDLPVSGTPPERDDQGG